MLHQQTKLLEVVFVRLHMCINIIKKSTHREGPAQSELAEIESRQKLQ